MILATDQHYLLPPGISTVVIFALTLALAAAWVALHRAARPTRAAMGIAMIAGRVAVGFLTMLAAAQAAQRVVLLATNWPIWPIALAGALSIEAVLGLYKLERRSVSRPTGIALAMLRGTATLLVVVMLAQPVVSMDRDEYLPRYVAVLVDESASMYIPDAQMTPSEKIRLAEMFGVKAATRFYRLEDVARRMRETRARVDAIYDSLTILKELKGEQRSRRLLDRRADLHEALGKLAELVGEQVRAVAKATDGRLKLPESVATELKHVKTEISRQIHDRLTRVAKFTEDDKEIRRKLPERFDRLMSALRRSAVAGEALAPKIEALGEKIDETFYGSLSPEDRQAVDRIAGRTRLQIARAVLLHRRPNEAGGDQPDESLMDRLKDKYGILLYSFASSPAETDAKWLDGLAAPDARTGPSTRPAPQPAAKQRTDFAEALGKVMADTPAERLAGVLLLTDGHHNAARAVEPVARRLGLLHVPICSVVLGSRKPPIDAAILAIDAPETVYAKDTVTVTAKVKLDGLAGKSARVSLYRGDLLVDEKLISVPADAFRRQVQLSHEPNSAGMQSYQVKVQSFDDEVFATNNAQSFHVRVTNDRVQMLLIDGRPRWEFRYLKNLFASRDRTVKLQYVVFEPDRIAGARDRPKVPAAAGLPPGRIEATALPDKPAEWMKFDLIVLGDVAPARFGPQDLQSLRKFVIDRGGTLIVIAGPRHMPQEFASGPLAELLPVRLLDDPDAGAGVDTKDGFRIALTPQGRDSIIMRQAADAQGSRRIWSSMPKAYWRLPIAEAKIGADVLAYALPDSAPKYMADPPKPDRVDRDLLDLRRKFMRKNALIAVQRTGMGRVMFLAFDRTWRLRYRAGDVHHHKFWGQVLRWATADKLPAGTESVKLGTDRTRYTPQSRVHVRAKIVRPDLSPVVSKEIMACVYSGRKLVLRRRLAYQDNSPGLYVGDLGELPVGNYSVKLESPQVQALLAAEGVKEVACDFAVQDTSPAEQTELAANRGLLGRLASLTGGAVAEAPQAGRLLDVFGEGTLIRHERKQYIVWNNWPYLVFIIMLVTAEWLLRKKVGLA